MAWLRILLGAAATALAYYVGRQVGRGEALRREWGEAPPPRLPVRRVNGRRAGAPTMPPHEEKEET